MNHTSLSSSPWDPISYLAIQKGDIVRHVNSNLGGITRTLGVEMLVTEIQLGRSGEPINIRARNRFWW